MRASRSTGAGGGNAAAADVAIRAPWAGRRGAERDPARPQPRPTEASGSPRRAEALWRAAEAGGLPHSRTLSRARRRTPATRTDVGCHGARTATSAVVAPAPLAPADLEALIVTTLRLH